MSLAKGNACFYFGTFNPIHNGHLMVAQSALSQWGPILGFDRVTFVPAGQPPQRQQEPDMLAATLRLKLVQLATADNPAFQVSPVEVNRPGHSYTVETLNALQQSLRLSTPIPFIIGADALSRLHTWHQPEALIERLRFLQAPRPGFETVTTLIVNDQRRVLNTETIAMPPVAISASWIRASLAGLEGSNPEALRYYLPPAVYRFIQWNGLYTQNKRADNVNLF